MPLLHALRGAAPAGCNANLQIKKIRINKKKLSETAQLTVPGSFCVEMEFMRIQDGFRAKSQMQDVLICENGVAVYRQCGCRRMSCLPSDRDGLLMHKYYRGDLYETANIYCNRILSGENRG